MCSDLVSVVDSSTLTRTTQISLGYQPELSVEQSGEALFYDSRISHDGRMSCYSCHSGGHTCGHLNDNLSDGRRGIPKRFLSLLWVSDTGPWAWNGQVKTLEEQVANSIETTMQGKAAGAKDISALVSYVKTLPAPPQFAITREDSSDVQVQRGAELFNALACRRCHTPPPCTSGDAYEVGFGPEKFKQPSLMVSERLGNFLKSADSYPNSFRHGAPSLSVGRSGRPLYL